MITVPGQPAQPVPKIDPTFFALAAADMHREGKLFEPPTELKLPAEALKK